MYKRYELCIPSLNYCSTNQITPSISEHENFNQLEFTFNY